MNIHLISPCLQCDTCSHIKTASMYSADPIDKRVLLAMFDHWQHTHTVNCSLMKGCFCKKAKYCEYPYCMNYSNILLLNAQQSFEDIDFALRLNTIPNTIDDHLVRWLEQHPDSLGSKQLSWGSTLMNAVFQKRSPYNLQSSLQWYCENYLGDWSAINLKNLPPSESCYFLYVNRNIPWSRFNVESKQFIENQLIHSWTNLNNLQLMELINSKWHGYLYNFSRYLMKQYSETLFFKERTRELLKILIQGCYIEMNHLMTSVNVTSIDTALLKVVHPYDWRIEPNLYVFHFIDRLDVEWMWDLMIRDRMTRDEFNIAFRNCQHFRIVGWEFFVLKKTYEMRSLIPLVTSRTCPRLAKKNPILGMTPIELLKLIQRYIL